MPSKNDLSALKAKSQGTLKVASKTSGATGKSRGGRPAKPVAEKESFTVPLRLTEAEGAILVKKAGLVPLATFVKAYLRQNTELLK